MIGRRQFRSTSCDHYFFPELISHTAESLGWRLGAATPNRHLPVGDFIASTPSEHYRRSRALQDSDVALGFSNRRGRLLCACNSTEACAESAFLVVNAVFEKEY